MFIHAGGYVDNVLLDSAQLEIRTLNALTRFLFTWHSCTVVYDEEVKGAIVDYGMINLTY